VGVTRLSRAKASRRVERPLRGGSPSAGLRAVTLPYQRDDVGEPTFIRRSAMSPTGRRTVDGYDRVYFRKELALGGRCVGRKNLAKNPGVRIDSGLTVFEAGRIASDRR